ncbi:MAG: polysaccharide deacetylase family protein [Rhodocyclaceae bacterium]|nr:MAG: polysaccharide deacetylase family protein [Rhodocyclaceae bacterium]
MHRCRLARVAGRGWAAGDRTGILLGRDDSTLREALSLLVRRQGGGDMRHGGLVLDAGMKLGALRLGLRLLRSPPLILMYHGVTRSARPDGLRNLDGKHMPQDIFASHLRLLAKYRRVVPLQTLVDGLGTGEDMRDWVAITFDDGYENNASVAAPLLADFNMSAAFFLTTGFIGTDRCMWTDRLEWVLDLTQRTELKLPGGGGQLSIVSLEDKSRALARLKTLIKGNRTWRPEEIVDVVADQLGVSASPAGSDYRFMDWDQARSLAQGGFEVGAHTVTHPILAHLSPEAARAEIFDSRDAVWREVGQCSPTFCYPNGKSSDFNAEIQALCHQEFRSALSTERGHAALQDLWGLKRLCPAGPGKGENLEWLLLRAR